MILLGNVRSGTSLLHDLFDLHPEVVSWYEPRTIWTYADPARRHDRFDERDATPQVVRYVRRRFLHFQRSHGNRRIFEKTPSNMLRIPYVSAIFPEAKLLYVVREPLANISSSELKWRQPITLRTIVRRVRETPKTQLHYYARRLVADTVRSRVLRQKHVSVWGVRYPGIYEDLARLSIEEVIARQWAECSRQAEEDLSRIEPSRLLRLRYEDFVADPVGNFERLLRHFGLTMTSTMEAALRKRVDPNRQRKWERLPPEVIAACIPIVESEMRRHGYAVPRLARSGAMGEG